MERGRQAHEVCDVGGREAVIETKLEQQPIRGVELCERVVQRFRQLGRPELGLGARVVAIRELGRVDGLPDQIDQSATCAARFRSVCGCRRWPLSAVLRAVPVEAQTPRDDDEPRGELAATIGAEAPEPAIVVLSQPVEYPRERIHRCIAVSRE